MYRSLILICVLGVAGCSAKPEPTIPSLSDVSLGDDPVSLAIAEAVGDEVASSVVNQAVAQIDPPKAGLFGRLFGGDKTQQATPPISDDVGADDSDTPIEGPDGEASQEIAMQIETPETAPAPVAKRGFFGRIFGAGPPVATQPADVKPVAVEAAVTADTSSVPNVPAPAKSGFFAGILAPKAPTPPAARTGPDAQEVTADIVLPYGQIARNCGVSRRALGTKVDENAGYMLYDSAPTTTGLRTHYITGFKDNCARQFTAATSLMGDIGTHEVVRYLPSNKGRGYSVAEAAYETVKASFCRVGHGVPCGAKLDRLARNTTFITAYERFGSNPTWSNILLHDGRVVAMGPADN